SDLPPESRYVRFVRLQSRLLSEFHQRPVELRAGVLLPRGFSPGAGRKYPLRVYIPGLGGRYSEVSAMMAPRAAFRRAWLAADEPEMILLHLDGIGPWGDSYQINSANNGPCGDALTQELIPYVERAFGAIGEPRARFLQGGSTGGWASLAL